MTFFGYGMPFPYAGEIWRDWAQGPPSVTGTWKELPPRAHESWLHVAQSAWFRSGRAAKRYGDASSYDIGGAGLVDIAGFYCALGESINGPGGYFGSNLSALADCLANSGPHGRQLFRLRWSDFESSRRDLGEDLAEVLAVLDEFGVGIDAVDSGTSGAG
ncbi:barstar family protein [Streptomyces phytohabitans]|uniref:barstar family protein n=1 Tax=Streptomyces phytohabitans TaxID=1150371 RepID=UPI00345C164F